jgi:hypothetical protein
MLKIWQWIIQSARDIYSFAYQEIGRALALLKDPQGKYSHKRIIALALIVNGLYMSRGITSWLTLVVPGLCIVFGTVLAIYSAVTKT